MLKILSVYFSPLLFFTFHIDVFDQFEEARPPGREADRVCADKRERPRLLEFTRGRASRSSAVITVAQGQR